MMLINRNTFHNGQNSSYFTPLESSIGISENGIVPVYNFQEFSGQNGSIIYLDEEKKDFMFFKPKPPDILERRESIYKSFPKLLKRLVSVKGSSEAYLFTRNREEQKVICNTGYISDPEGNVLLCLCYEGKNIVCDFESLFNEGEIKNENLILYVSSKFERDPLYLNLYKRIKKEYIDALCVDNKVRYCVLHQEVIEDTIFNALKYTKIESTDFMEIRSKGRDLLEGIIGYKESQLDYGGNLLI